MTTHSMSVDVLITTLWSAVGRMSVICQWCIGRMSVMYSSQYPSSNGGILPTTPSASVRSKFQLFLVIFSASKLKLLWRQSCISNKIINLHEKFSFSNRMQLAHIHDKDNIIVHKAWLTLYESVVNFVWEHVTRVTERCALSVLCRLI